MSDERTEIGAAAAAALASGDDGAPASTGTNAPPSAATGAAGEAPAQGSPESGRSAADGMEGATDGAAAQPAGGDGGGDDAQEHISPVERAARAAEQRLAAAKDGASKTDTQTDSSSEAAAQAGSDADSTPEAAADGDGADAHGAEQAGGDADSIPGLDHWPAERREAFAKLPQEAQGVVREIAGDLQAGFTKATQALSNLKRELPELSKAVLAEGVAPARVLDYARAGKLFEQNPEQALRALAQQAGLDVRFPNDPDPAEIPDFQSKEELARWLDEQQDKKLSAREQQMRQRQQVQQAQQSLQQEIDAAAQRYPDLNRNAVMQAIADSNGMLTAEQAYWLPKLRETVQGQQSLQAENAQLKAKLKKLEQAEESRAKRLLDVGGRRDSAPPVNGRDDGLSPIERAARAAEQRLAMR